MLEKHHENVILLFSDVDLGTGIDGFAVARHVDEHWPHNETVIASGKRLAATKRHARQGDLHLKPLGELSVIRHLAKTLIDGKQPEPLKRAMA